MNLNEIKIYVTNNKNKMVVDECEQIALENNIKNGGTLLFHNLIKECSDYVIYCSHKKNIVGYLALTEDNVLPNDIYIMQVAVKKEYKKQGIASLMYKYAFEHSKQYQYITAHVNSNNPASIYMHRKMNFICEELDNKLFFYKPTKDLHSQQCMTITDEQINTLTPKEKA